MALVGNFTLCKIGRESVIKKVIIIKNYDRKFRLPLYNILIPKLLSNGIDLHILFGQGNKYENLTIKDQVQDYKFGTYLKTHYFYLGRKSCSYQNIWPFIKNIDMIIVQQGNNLLINHLLLLKRKVFNWNTKIAFWGHGKNFQAKNSNSILEQIKKFYSKMPDFWFAYNDLAKKIVYDLGYPENRIVSLENTIDVRTAKSEYKSITEGQLKTYKKKYNIKDDTTVGIYCGSLYREKRITFLFETLLEIKKTVDNFKFFIIGDGELSKEVTQFSEDNNDFCFYMGKKYGVEKIIFFKLSSFQLIPGSVGLNIIDSFAFETPLITTNDSCHGPEISYLINGKNGIITDNNRFKYASSIISLIQKPYKLELLRNGCKVASNKYTIENMAENFYMGITTALKLEKLYE